MDRPEEGLEPLTRSERAAVRAVLIRATALAGRRRDGDQLPQLEELVRAAPIGALPAAANTHRVAGTVLWGLEGVAEVPADVSGRLDAIRQQSSLRHLLLTGVLGRIGRVFDDNDLAWVAMKGPVVAALLYRRPGDRSYADLDLLLVRRDFGRAVRLLEDLGFRHRVRDWALASDVFVGQVGMTNGTVDVDLHWHLHFSRQDRRPFALDPEAMVGRARRVVVSGVTAPTLDPVDTVITLAFHAARSAGHRLIWLKDIERAVSVEQPDLDEVVRRSHRYRCAPPVGLMLGRARALLDASVPDEVVRAMLPAALRATDRFTCALVHPVQLDERPTVTRAFTRSVRSSVGASLAGVPIRAARGVKRLLLPTRWNDIDSLDDKDRYLRAVAGNVDR